MAIDLNLNDEMYADELPLAPGLYDLECQKAEVKDTAKGGQMLSLQHKIVGVEEDVEQPDGSDPQGRYVFDTLPFPDSGMSIQGRKLCGRRIRQACEAFGVEYGDHGFDEQDFVSVTAKAKLKTGKDQDGNPRAEIAFYMPDE